MKNNNTGRNFFGRNGSLALILSVLMVITIFAPGYAGAASPPEDVAGTESTGSAEGAHAETTHASVTDAEATGEETTGTGLEGGTPSASAANAPQVNILKTPVDPYYLTAHSFVQALSSVTGKADEIIAAAHAFAYEYTEQGEVVQVPVAVKSNHGYTAAEGSYAVTLSFADRPTSLSKTIQALVVDRDQISYGTSLASEADAPLYYYTAANHLMISSREAHEIASSGPAALRKALAAEAWVTTTDGTGLEPATLSILDDGGFFAANAQEGSSANYYVLLAPGNANGGQILANVFVYPVQPPVLFVSNYRFIEALSSGHYELTRADIMENVSAYENGLDVTDRVTYTITNQRGESVSAIDTAVRGLYKVVYQLTDTDGNIVTAIRYIEVNKLPDVLPPLKQYSLIAENFEISAQTATGSIEEILLYSKAVAVEFDEQQGALRTTPAALTVEDTGGYCTAPGIYEITISIQADPSVFTKITATVLPTEDKGNEPVIHVGDPLLFPVTADSHVLTREELMISVSALDIEDGDLTDQVTYEIVDRNGTTVSGIDTLFTYQHQGVYRIVYSVTDSNGNSATKERAALVYDFIAEGYRIQAVSFVKKLSDVTDTNDRSKISQEIIAASHARGWGYLATALGESYSPSEVYVILDGGYRPFEGDYIIALQANAFGSYGGDSITAKVVDKDVLVTGELDSGSWLPTSSALIVNHAVAANHTAVTLDTARTLTGGGSANAELIRLAEAEAWTMNGKRTYQLEGTIDDAEVIVISNGIPADPEPGTAYPVTFGVAERPDISATVNFTIDRGNAPVITGASPLFVEKTAHSQIMTRDEIMAGISVSDVEEGTIPLENVNYTIEGYVDLINRQYTGVYQATYTVTDGSGNQSVWQRAIVVTDGRYALDEPEGVILGARDFVITRTDVVGSEGLVRSASYVEAYGLDGAPLEINLESMPEGFTLNAVPGSYSFTFNVSGTAVKTTVRGLVIDASVLDPGSKDSGYALSANHCILDVITTQSPDIDLDARLIEAAGVAVHKLRSDLPDMDPVVIDDDGFSYIPGVYRVRFGVEGIPASELSVVVNVNISVLDDRMPVLSVASPIFIQKGETFDPLQQVLATDYEDGNLISKVTWSAIGEPVNMSKTGIYQMLYSVEDSAYNTATAKRIVVVGMWELTVDRYMLIAESFAKTLEAGNPSPTDVTAEILSRSRAKLYDLQDGQMVAGNITVVNSDGYNPGQAGLYNIRIQAEGATGALLTLDLQGEIVNADTMENDRGSGVIPDPETIYVFGSKVELSQSSAEAIIHDSRGYETAMLEMIGATARKISRSASSIGDISPVGVVIHPNSPAFDSTPGTVNEVLISDENLKVTARVAVTIAYVPPIALPQIELTTPLVIPVSTAAGMLSKAQLLEGVTAVDGAGDPLPVDILDNPAIEAHLPSMTKVTYTVTDPSYQTVTKSRLVIVDDGNFVYDDAYALRAAPYLIGDTSVRVPDKNAQVLTRSQAVAMHLDGTPAAAQVLDLGGYDSHPNNYMPIIAVEGHTTLSKNITVKVLSEWIGLDGTDGPYIANGARYALQADSARINPRDASALYALGTNSPAFADAILTRTHAASYLRVSGLLPAGTPVLVDGSEFTSKTGVYMMTIGVMEDPTAAVQIYVIVSGGLQPTISVGNDISRQMSENHVALTWGEIMQGVIAWDKNDETDITSSITYELYDKTAKVTLSAIYEDEPGFYEATYTAVDHDGNRISATRKINVGNFIVVDGSVFHATAFVKSVREVTGINAEILAATGAKAWMINSHYFGTDYSPLPVSVNDTDGYAAAVGEYQVSLHVAGGFMPITEQRTAKVVDKDVVATAPLSLPPTYSGILTNYAVGANHIALSLSDARQLSGTGSAVKAELIRLADAEAWELTHTVTAAAVELIANAIPENPVPGASYPVRFGVEGISGAQYTAVVDCVIESAQPPVLYVKSPVVVTIGAIYDPMQDVSAYSNVEGDLTSRVSWSAIGDAVDVSTRGAYTVEYHVSDSYGNTSVASRTVIVGAILTLFVPAEKIAYIGDPFTEADYMDGVIAWDSKGLSEDITITHDSPVDTNQEGSYSVRYTAQDSQGNSAAAIGIVTVIASYEYHLSAHSFVINRSEVSATSVEIFNASDVMVGKYNHKTNAYDLNASLPAIRIANLGGYAPATGDYAITLTAGDGIKETSLPLVAKVVEMDALTRFTTGGPYTQIVDNWDVCYIGANHLELNATEAKVLAQGGEQAIIAAVSGAAWSVSSDGASLSDLGIALFDDGGFIADSINGNGIGAYAITLAVSGRTDARVSVYIQTNAPSPPVLNAGADIVLKATAAHTPLTRDQILDGVYATDLTDGNLINTVAYSIYSRQTNSTVSAIYTDEPGTYEMTYSVSNSAGLSASATRLILVEPAEKPPIIIGGGTIIEPPPLSNTSGALSRDDLLNGIIATDPDGNNITDDIAIAIRGESGQAVPEIRLDQDGAYLVKYTLKDSAGNESEASRVIVVNNEAKYTLGKDYILHAGSFTENVMNLTGSPGELLSRTTSYVLQASDLASSSAVLVDADDYTREGGEYHIVVAAPHEPDLKSTIKVVITADTYRVTFDANGGMLNSARSFEVRQPRTQLSALPTDPAREGYVFVGWNTSPYGAVAGGMAFTANSSVTRDMMLFAQWIDAPVQIPDAPPLRPAPQAPVVIAPPPTVIIAEEIAPEPIDSLNPAPVITTGGGVSTIKPGKTPTSAPEATVPGDPGKLLNKDASGNDGWTLINLFCAMISIGIMIAMLIGYFANRRNESEFESEFEYARSGRRIDLIVALINIAAAAVSLTMLFVGQDFSGKMQAIDGFTIGAALILLIQIISPFLKVLKKNHSDFDDMI